MYVTRLEIARRLAGMSQTALADLVGVHRVNVSQVERLHRRPHPSLRRKLAEALGYPEAVLVDGDGWPRAANVDDLSWIHERGRIA
ncbi:helix-turn-helix domain-containing protein [Alicyclobacillus shizuokensis]|uniref:helix-turn-helix domain-containing protein n=1 Tax=Alicyclobacillus shizuokensis TaxID=392014 RepID=UPI00082AC2EC|nr:helix-turn-helix transcriptional regulator [Alicyclobacillus shizuokensis]